MSTTLIQVEYWINGPYYPAELCFFLPLGCLHLILRLGVIGNYPPRSETCQPCISAPAEPYETTSTNLPYVRSPPRTETRQQSNHKLHFLRNSRFCARRALPAFRAIWLPLFVISFPGFYFLLLCFARVTSGSDSSSS